MAQQNRDSKAAVGLSAAATIAAVAAWLNSRKQVAAGEIPDEVIQLIMAIAASSNNIEGGIQQLITELSNLGINVQGWPPNVRRIRTFTIVCAVAGQPYRGSPMAIPSGRSLVVKANALNAVGSLIYVATAAAECTNPNSSYPLVPNEPIGYAVQNAEDVYVCSNVAGSTAIFSAEQEL